MKKNSDSSSKEDDNDSLSDIFSLEWCTNTISVCIIINKKYIINDKTIFFHELLRIIFKLWKCGNISYFAILDTVLNPLNDLSGWE